MADVIEIAELVGRASVTDKISMNSTPQQTEYKTNIFITCDRTKYS